MNLNSQIKEIKKIQNGKRKIGIQILVSPSMLEIIDEKCKELRLPRGDLLSASFLFAKYGDASSIENTEENSVEGTEEKKKQKERDALFLLSAKEYHAQFDSAEGRANPSPIEFFREKNGL